MTDRINTTLRNHNSLISPRLSMVQILCQIFVKAFVVFLDVVRIILEKELVVE